VRGYAKHPIWATEPRLAIFTDLSMYLWPGFPGPPSAAATEALSNYIIVDMFSKAVLGMKPQDAVTWAEQQLKRIYEKT